MEERLLTVAASTLKEAEKQKEKRGRVVVRNSNVKKAGNKGNEYAGQDD